MKILFLHQNSPAQFAHLARALRADPRVDVRALTDASNRQPVVVPTTRY